MHRTQSQRATCALSLCALLLLGACSPYVYKEEIATFGSGVDASVKAFTGMKPSYTAWAIEQRDKRLLRGYANTGVKPSASDACETLRSKYERAFAQGGAPEGDLLSAEDYAACSVTPLPKPDPERGLPKLEALGEALKAYVAGLQAIANAGDEDALGKAFGQFNTSAQSLVSTVNAELVKNNKATFDAIGALVYEAGLTYLRQRRFSALKQAINDNHAVVAQAAYLLAEAAFDIYGPTLSDKKAALDRAQNKAVSVTPANYIAVWSEIDKARDAYTKALKDSPIYAFARIRTTHAALRDSINDPINRDQFNALYENANALKKAADAALEAVQKDTD